MDIKVPSLAEGITSGTVVSILVEVGESVSKDQTLVELETEKAIAPLPAIADGVVATISVAEGDSVSVGQTIITLDSKETASENTPEANEESASAAPQATPQQNAPAPVVAPSSAQASSVILQEAKSVPSGFPPPASPSIRKLAAELGLDLYRVQGSGSGGRIEMEDLRAYVAELQRIALSPQTAATTATAASNNIEPLPDFSRFGHTRTESMSLLRKKISEKMSASWAQVVHVNQFDEAQVDNILKLRAKHKEAYASKGKRFTVTALLIKALANTLKEHPVFNAAIDTVNETIIYKEYVNIGLAVDTPQGTNRSCD
jgi:pyruvate dehydrogenase E2 component (dihydrolipoamide acetyltransferase)